MKNKGFKIAALCALSLMSLGCSLNGKHIYQTTEGAIGGYDPVAYFISQRAIKGKPAFTSSLTADSSLKHQAVKWYFSSVKNKKLFDQSPEKYTPQYGGYCAYAMSFGLVVKSDPQAFTLLNEKLYLNYSLKVREKWLKNSGEYINKANKKWSAKI